MWSPNRMLQRPASSRSLVITTLNISLAARLSVGYSFCRLAVQISSYLHVHTFNSCLTHAILNSSKIFPHCRKICWLGVVHSRKPKFFYCWGFLFSCRCYRFSCPLRHVDGHRPHLAITARAQQSGSRGSRALTTLLQINAFFVSVSDVMWRCNEWFLMSFVRFRKLLCSWYFSTEKKRSSGGMATTTRTDRDTLPPECRAKWRKYTEKSFSITCSEW